MYDVAASGQSFTIQPQRDTGTQKPQYRSGVAARRLMFENLAKDSKPLAQRSPRPAIAPKPAILAKPKPLTKPKPAIKLPTTTAPAVMTKPNPPTTQNPFIKPKPLLTPTKQSVTLSPLSVSTGVTIEPHKKGLSEKLDGAPIGKKPPIKAFTPVKKSTPITNTGSTTAVRTTISSNQLFKLQQRITKNIHNSPFGDKLYSAEATTRMGPLKKSGDISGIAVSHESISKAELEAIFASWVNYIERYMPSAGKQGQNKQLERYKSVLQEMKNILDELNNAKVKQTTLYLARDHQGIVQGVMSASAQGMIDQLVVAPWNIDSPLVSEKEESYKGIGRCLVEVKLSESERVTLNPLNQAAYQSFAAMGFTGDSNLMVLTGSARADFLDNMASWRSKAKSPEVYTRRL